VGRHQEASANASAAMRSARLVNAE